MKISFWTLVAVLALGGAARGDDTRVLVIAFNTLHVPPDQQWIGKGVQETLLADLGRSEGVTPVAFKGRVIVEDNATAARLARQAHSTLAIRGTVQGVGSNVQLTAQLVDAHNGDILRTASATGPAADLLKLEGDLTDQLRSPADVPAMAAGTAPPAPPSPQSSVVAPPAPQVYYPQTYNYANGYNPYSGYPFGYYSPVIYTTGGRDGRHGHDRPGRGGHVDAINVSHNSALPVPQGAGLLPIMSGPGNMPVPSGPGMLPIPTNNVLPVPRNNVAPVPTHMVAPVPTRSGNPAPTRGAAVATAGTGVPRSNAGQIR